MHRAATLEHYTPFVEQLNNIRIITKYNLDYGAAASTTTTQ